MIRSRFCASSSCARLFLTWLLAAGGAAAQELGDGVQLHGFVSQALVHSSDNNVGGDSAEGVAWDLRELGLNLSWRPHPDWLLSAQALSRRAGDADDGSLRLDYGFVDHTFLSYAEGRAGVRVGKVKNPYGFYNTTRDVAHTRPGILMPQSVYLDRIRDFFLAAPGIALYGDHATAAGALSWQFNLLRPQVDDAELERVFLLRNWPGQFEGRRSWMGQVHLDSADGRWHAGLSAGEFRMRYKPGRLPPFDWLGGRHALPTWVLSLEHNREHWSLTAEYAQTTVKAREYGPVLDDNTTQSWYVQATWRMPAAWQTYLRYDTLHLDKDDRDGALFSRTTGLPGHLRYARDWVLGVRKDVGALALSAEVHHVDGSAWLALADNPATGMVRRWDMLLLQAAWRF